MADIFKTAESMSDEELREFGSAALPDPGGKIFMSADKGPPVRGGIGADMNAARMMSLPGALPPEFCRGWLRIRASPAGGDAPKIGSRAF